MTCQRARFSHVSAQTGGQRQHHQLGDSARALRRTLPWCRVALCYRVVQLSEYESATLLYCQTGHLSLALLSA